MPTKKAAKRAKGLNKGKKLQSTKTLSMMPYIKTTGQKQGSIS